MQDFLNQFGFAYYMIGYRYLFMAASAFILFYIIFRTPMLSRKIQAKFPQHSDYYRDVFYSVISIGIFAAISTLTLRTYVDYTNIYKNIGDYSSFYYAFTFVWMFFLHDFYFYWTHRLMHEPTIFRYVHLTHHKSNNPTPWTAYAFHPLEAVQEAAIVPLIAILLPVHRSAIIIYMIFQIAYNVYGHLGFEIFPKGMHQHWLGKWFNTSVSHNMHHKYSVKNYGLWTTIWDRLFGTMHPKYDETYTAVTENSTHTEGVSLSH